MRDLIERALEWVRAVLLGPRTAGRHSRAHLAERRPPAAQVQPQDWRPDPYDARWRRWARNVERCRLTGRPLPHFPGPWQQEPAGPVPPPSDQEEDSGSLVRPYVTAHAPAARGEQR
ncbi:hypothetical protein [Streptomyces xinghaiensis]|uniref:hypothetical protein n=1 Tax=Streptomyces xinghaiensis TaxID=1038928 RepID=UPI0012FFB4F0|nr:hypothetical protein [Streptomyces xinghaiensis]MZE77894.1 hypothetical protein [Streptomyces sp. SID5475]